MKIYLIILCLLASLSMQAQNITATVTVTAAGGTVNGNAITVNGTQRLFTNNVVNSATQITTFTNIGGAASNLFIAYAVKRENGMDIATVSTNAMVFKGFTGYPLTVTLGGSWGTVSLSTNAVTNMTTVRVPMGGVGSVERTNVESGLVDYLNDNKGANIVATNAPFFISYVNTNGNQQISGAKTFNGSINGVVGNLTNGTWTNPSFTNAQNFGTPFRSPGTGTDSENFGRLSLATDNEASAFGFSAHATGPEASAFGGEALATGIGDTAIGNLAEATGGSGFSGGIHASTSGFKASALGAFSSSAYNSASAIGAGSATTTNHQIMMGTALEYTHFAGGVLFTGVETNFTGAGTNTITGQLAFPRFNVTSLANGGNAAIPIGTSINVFISGNTAAFSTDGIAGGVDGRIVEFTSRSSFTWTIPNQSGFESVPANRIDNGLGGTNVVTLVNNPKWADFRYDATASCWILRAHSN